SPHPCGRSTPWRSRVSARSPPWSNGTPMSLRSTSWSTRPRGRRRSSTDRCGRGTMPFRPDLGPTLEDGAPPPSLREVQRAMARSLLDGNDDAAAGFVVTDGLAAGRRLSVYRNTFEASLANALRLAFPAVLRLVGADFFASVAHAFVHAEP